jgi:hypothetical protein
MKRSMHIKHKLQVRWVESRHQTKQDPLEIIKIHIMLMFCERSKEKFWEIFLRVCDQLKYSRILFTKKKRVVSCELYLFIVKKKRKDGSSSRQRTLKMMMMMIFLFSFFFYILFENESRVSEWMRRGKNWM